LVTGWLVWVIGSLISAAANARRYATIKYDGTPGTAYVKDGELYVCSRNLSLRDDAGNPHWIVARQNNLLTALRDTNLALQFEVVGPKIQGNPLGLKNFEMRAFSLYDIANHRYVGARELLAFCGKNSIPAAASIFFDISLNYTSDSLRELAQQQYPNGKPAEGIVIRTVEEQQLCGIRASFKVINLMYKQ